MREEVPRPRLYWLPILAVVFVLSQFVLPSLLERYQYAMTRGRERAEAETAASALESSGLEQLSLAYQQVSKRVGPSVVHINVVSLEEVPVDEFSSFFGYRQARGQGSGVIVDSEGYILTNNHVVRGATQIRVGLSDGRVVDAKVLGKDAATGLGGLEDLRRRPRSGGMG